jgi:hypothetical protein
MNNRTSLDLTGEWEEFYWKGEPDLKRIWSLTDMSRADHLRASARCVGWRWSWGVSDHISAIDGGYTLTQAGALRKARRAYRRQARQRDPARMAVRNDLRATLPV